MKNFSYLCTQKAKIIKYSNKPLNIKNYGISGDNNSGLWLTSRKFV